MVEYTKSALQRDFMVPSFVFCLGGSALCPLSVGDEIVSRENGKWRARAFARNFAMNAAFDILDVDRFYFQNYHDLLYSLR